jgi:hypothetical protein
MPINPIDPSKKTSGNGSEKYTPPKEKFEPSEYDKKAEKVKQENEKAKADAHRMAQEQRAKVEAERPRTYAERLQDMGRLPKPSVGSGGFGGNMTDPMERKTKPYNKAKGGIIKSSASKRADGIAIKGKTKGRIV